MAGLSASGLKTQIKSYTETDSNVLTDAVLENIILNAQYRIFRDVPIDADRKQQTGNLVTGQETINAPAGAVFPSHDRADTVDEIYSCKYVISFFSNQTLAPVVADVES